MATGSTADIGIRVFLDDAAAGGLTNINSALRGMGAYALTAGNAFQRMSAQTAMLGVLGGFTASMSLLVAGLKWAVQSAADFQQAMFGVAVATHVSMQAAMGYAPTVMQLGASSNYTSAQIADGISLLGRATYSIQQIMDPVRQIGADYTTTGGQVVRVSASMAQAAVDLSVAIRGTADQGFGMLAQAMAAYQAPAQQSVMYADLLQFAFEHQQGTVSQLQAGLSQLTGVAAQVHTPFNELVAALDTVSPAMGGSARAGTALRYTLSGVLSPTAGAITEMKKLGLASIDAGGNVHSAFYNANGSAKDLSQILAILHEKFKTLTQKDQMDALHAIFSIKGSQGIEVLLQQYSKYVDLMKQLNDTNNNAGGVTQRFQQQQQNLSFATAALSTSIKDLGVAIGLILIPYVTSAVNWINDHFVSAIRNMIMTSSQAGTAVITFIKFAAVLSGLGIAGALVAMAFMGILPPIVLMAGIIGGVIIGTMALAAGLTYLSMHASVLKPILSEIKTVLVTLGTAASGVAMGFAGFKLADLIGQFVLLAPRIIATTAAFLAQVPAVIAAGVQWLLASVRATILTVVMASQMIPTLISMGVAWLVSLGPALLMAGAVILLIAIFAAMGVGLFLLIQRFGGLHMLLNLGHAIWTGLVAVFNQVAATVRGALAQAFQQLQPVFQQVVTAFNQARPALLIFGQILGGVLVVAIAIIIGVLHGLINVIGVILVTVIRVAAGIIQAFMGVIQFFLGFFALLHGLATGNTVEIQNAFAQMGLGIRNIFVGLWSAVSSIFVGAFNAIRGFVSGFIAGIVGFFEHLSSVLVGHSIIPDMLHAILNAFMSILAAVVGVVVGFISNIIGHIASWAANMVSHAQSALSQFGSAISNGWNNAVNWVKMGVANMLLAIGMWELSMISKGQSALAQFGSTINNGINTAVNFIAGLPGKAVSALSNLGSMLFNSGATAMQQFANGLGSTIGAVVQQVQNAAGQVANFLQHASPAKMGPLSNDDKWMPNMMKMFASGINDNVPLLQNAATKAAGGIASAPSTARLGAPTPGVGGGAGGAGGTTTVNLVLDGNILGQAVINHVTGQMQLNGGGRAFR